MSDLRDARFQRALEAAPDEQAEPAVRTRLAVLAAARAALDLNARAALEPVASPVSRWRRWWSGAGRPRMPWNAAFASVLLASLVTVLWRDQDIPDAALDEARRDMPAPAAVSPQAPPAASNEVQPAPPPATAPPVAAPAEPPAIRQEQSAAKPKARTAPAPLPADTSTPTPTPMRESTSRQAAESGVGSNSKSSEKAERSAPPQPAGAATAPAAQMSPPTPQLQARAMPTEWTSVRLTMDGRMVEIPRAEAARLVGPLDAMVALARSDDPLSDQVTARLETMLGNKPTGLLELAPPQIRWTPQRGTTAGSSRTARPDRAQLDAMQAELARLTTR